MKVAPTIAAVLLGLLVIVSVIAIGQAFLVTRRIFLVAAVILMTALGAAMLAAARRSAGGFLDARQFGLAGIFVFLVVGMLKSVFIYDAPVTLSVATAGKAVLVAAAVLLGFLVGSTFGLRPGAPGRMARSELAANRIFPLTLLLGLVGLVGSFGFDNPLAPFDPAVSNYARLLAGCLPAAGALAIWLLFTARPATPGRRLAFIAVLVPLPVLALINRSRVPLVFLISFAFLVYVYRLWLRRPQRFPTGRVAALAVGVALLLLFTAAAVDMLAAAQWRIDVATASYHPAAVFTPVLLAFEKFTAVDAFDNLVRTIELYPDRGRYLYGWSVVAVLVNPIPRSLWPGKPYGFGRLLVEELGLGHYGGLSLSPSLAGELLANFGYLGPFLGYLLMGVVAASLYQRFLRAGTYSPFHVLYLAGLILFLLESRGDLLSINIRVGWYLACMYGVLRLSVAAKTAAETSPAKSG